MHGAITSGALAVATSCASTPREGSQAGQATATPPSRSDPSPGLTLEPTTRPQDEQSILLAYFSRSGENYYYGDRIDLDLGNTEVLAGMIRDRLGCDVHRIVEADPYPQDYDATVARNVREQDADARPAIANTLPDLAGYGVVLLASPLWNVRPPMIMHTFTDALDFTSKTVHPITTHAMSGLGTAERDYAAACPGAVLGEGLAVQGEVVADSGPEIDEWLARTGLLTT